eukprot:GFUD01038613.1.p2 GENE.GFUD01038613.1~~GFUD01038613.1.p2  ORF type:complete len:106 (+),score=30.22 GFUD01038613.1:508-825(+)
MAMPMMVRNTFIHSKAIRPPTTLTNCKAMETAVSTSQGVKKPGRPVLAPWMRRGNDNVEDTNDEDDRRGDVQDSANSFDQSWVHCYSIFLHDDIPIPYEDCPADH